jgi:N-acetylglucosaminylphosphatidylinositol deacetylase
MKDNSVILLVTAHPDDEALFFGPFLCKCQASKALVHILCLSNGNYEGLGVIRQKELYESAKVFGIPRERVHIIKHELLEDGMENDWPIEVVAFIVKGYVDSICPDIVATFDEYGISGHPNHIATYRSLHYLFHSCGYRSSHPCILLALESVSIARKFLSILDYPFSVLHNDVLILQFALVKVFQAMWIHYSQFVWYRFLFILFSRYSFINTFKKV